ncbi:hypothetical protein [Marinovum algicola]
MSATSLKGGPFNWADPFLLDDQLSEEDRMIELCPKVGDGVIRRRLEVA